MSKRILIAGDWHGHEAWARRCIRQAAEQGIQLLVHLGDFGFWPASGTRYVGSYKQSYLWKVSQAAVDAGVELFVIPGNHEDYDFLEQLDLDGDGRGIAAPNVLTLPRGYQFSVEEVSFTAVGGAVSVDKGSRSQGTSWWPQEEITDDQELAIKRLPSTDVLLSHDAPSGYLIPGLMPRREFIEWVGHRIATEAQAHRQRISRILESLTPSLLLHGHYHVDYEIQLQSKANNGQLFTTRVVGLPAEGDYANLKRIRVDGREITVEQG